MAIADVFDALISRRVYKPPMPFAEAYEIIVAGRGSQFDPDVVTVFCDLYSAERPVADLAIVRGILAPATKAARRAGHPIHAAS